ncbi:MAG: histidine kinase N-terminal 7TM domain-containing protein, partial [Anaerovoracaceae bacterium]
MLENKTIRPAATILDAFTGFNWPEKALYREVLQQRQFIPADTEELHVSSVLLILLLTIFSVEAKKRVLHKGVRLGLYFTGVLLIGWIGLSIFKYSLFGYPVLERLCWYLFYFFMLPLPVLSLYIAQNADHTERNLLSLRVKLAGILAFAFFLLVITNDLHHLVFFFPAGEGRYTYQMGYYLLSGFFLLTQFGAFFVMLKKSWDSPKRKMTIFPAGITLLGLLYCIAYNTGHPTLSKLSLPLGMSLLVLSFWSSAFFSGLIHANRSYRSLFAHSSLDMQILDLNGQVHFRTANATPLPETFVPRSVLQKYSILLPEEEKLLWTTPIHGGLVMIKENIGEISRLRKKLGQLNRQRKRENQTLTQQEQVKQKLSLIKTQNLLTAEVNAVVQDKVREMLSLLPSLEGPLSTKKISQTKLYLLSFYCKRRCELLLREKQEADYPPQSLLHLLQEI